MNEIFDMTKTDIIITTLVTKTQNKNSAIIYSPSYHFKPL